MKLVENMHQARFQSVQNKRLCLGLWSLSGFAHFFSWFFRIGVGLCRKGVGVGGVGLGFRFKVNGLILRVLILMMVSGTGQYSTRYLVQISCRRQFLSLIFASHRKKCLVVLSSISHSYWVCCGEIEAEEQWDL